MEVNVKTKRWLTGLLVPVLGGSVLLSNAWAQEEIRVPEVRPELWSKFNQVVRNKSRRAQLLERVQERGLFCSSCHGRDGNGTRPHIPKLAGQNPPYILEQLEKFSDGRRNHYVMVPLAKQFTDEDKIGFALFFSRFKQVKAGGDPSLIADGKAVFERACVACHGADGRGSKGYARVAGQQPQYVRKTLTHFKMKAGDRQSDLMEQVSAGLNDHEIEAVSEYIGSMD